MNNAVAVRAEALQVREACARLASHFGHGDRVVVALDAGVAKWPEALRGNKVAAPRANEEATIARVVVRQQVGLTSRGSEAGWLARTRGRSA